MTTLVIASNVGGGIARHLDLTRTVVDLTTMELAESTPFVRKVQRVRHELHRRRPDRVVTHGVAAGLAVRLARRTGAGIEHLEFWHGDPFFLRARDRRTYRVLAKAGAAPTEQVFVNPDLVGRYGDPRSPARALPNTVPLQPEAATPAPRRAVYVGRLSPEKGHLDLLASWPTDPAGWTLAIYGAGQAVPDLPGGVTAEGLTADPLSVMAAAALVVIPSWVESSPYTALEAMSVGRPMVATSTGDLPELLSSGCGWLAGPRDVTDLRRALGCALGTAPAELALRGAQGRAWLAEHRPFGVWAREVEGIYGA